MQCIWVAGLGPGTAALTRLETTAGVGEEMAASADTNPFVMRKPPQPRDAWKAFFDTAYSQKTLFDTIWF